MKFKLYRENGSLNSAPVFGAVEQGLKNLGHSVVNSHEDIPVIWSVLWHGRMAANKSIFEKCRKQGSPVLVLEVGGISRGETWKVALNGVNNEAIWGDYSWDGLKRAHELGLTLRPWRSFGNHILICGQHEKSHQWRGMPPMSEWLRQTITTIRQYSDRQIIVRPHPRCEAVNIGNDFENVIKQTPQKVANSYDNFDMQFGNAWATISWNSNPGIQSIIAGIPAYTGPSSLAYEVSMKDLSQIEEPRLPQREQWLSKYSHTEFTISEIAEGIPFRNLLKKLD